MTMRWISFFAVLFLLAGCGASAQNTAGYRQISMDGAVAMMEEESNYVILDVRGFRKAGVPGISQHCGIRRYY